MQSQCRACGVELRATAKYCPACGKPLRRRLSQYCPWLVFLMISFCVALGVSGLQRLRTKTTTITESDLDGNWLIETSGPWGVAGCLTITNGLVTTYLPDCKRVGLVFGAVQAKVEGKSVQFSFQTQDPYMTGPTSYVVTDSTVSFEGIFQNDGSIAGVIKIGFLIRTYEATRGSGDDATSGEDVIGFKMTRR